MKQLKNQFLAYIHRAGQKFCGNPILLHLVRAASKIAVVSGRPRPKRNKAPPERTLGRATRTVTYHVNLYTHVHARVQIHVSRIGVRQSSRKEPEGKFKFERPGWLVSEVLVKVTRRQGCGSDANIMHRLHGTLVQVPSIDPLPL